MPGQGRTRRQIARRLLPFLFLLYIVNFLDRASVAYAAIGMSHDLGFNDRVFGLAFGIFFAGYVILQIPCAILVERWSARKMICLTMVAWGAMTGLTALVRTPNQLYLARLLLGAAEAGFFPGVVVYLGRWFLRQDRAKATSNFMSAIPLSFVIGSPIAGWILGHRWSGMPGWRWLFVVEGLPAVVLGIVAYFFLTDSPGEAQWLKAEQREWIARTLAKQKPQGENSATVWDVFRSGRALLLAGIAFLNYSVFYTFIFWLPTMLKRQSGLADSKIGWLGAIPYLVCLIVMPLNGWHRAPVAHGNASGDRFHWIVRIGNSASLCAPRNAFLYVGDTRQCLHFSFLVGSNGSLESGHCRSLRGTH